MTNSEREVTQVLRSLQAAATLCANTFTTAKLSVEYRVAYSAGAVFPWRLLEVHSDRHRNEKRYALRRMHCFRTPDCLRKSIQERAQWKACDQELVASYLVKVQGASQGPTMRELMPARLELRAQICVTRPERVIDLLRG